MNYGPRVEISHEGRIVVAELQDEEILEEAIINEVADSLFSVVADTPQIKLLLSFEKVKYLSSSALGMLIRLNKRVEENGGTLKLCQLRKSLYEIFAITKLDRLFESYDEKNTAISSFGT